MFRTGQRKLIAFLACVAASFLLLLLTLLRCPEYISAMGTALTSVFGVLLVLLVGGNIGERLANRSTPSPPPGSPP